MRFKEINLENEYQEFLASDNSPDLMRMDAETVSRVSFTDAYKKGYLDAIANLKHEAETFDPYAFAKDLADELEYVTDCMREELDKQ